MYAYNFKPSYKGINFREVFVVMPFDKKYDPIFSDLIKPAAIEANKLLEFSGHRTIDAFRTNDDIKTINQLHIPVGKPVRVRLTSIGKDGKHLQALTGGRKIIAFGLGHLCKQTDQPLDLLCRVGMNEWQGRTSLQLIVDDIRIAIHPSLTASTVSNGQSQRNGRSE